LEAIRQWKYRIGARIVAGNLLFLHLIFRARSILGRCRLCVLLCLLGPAIAQMRHLVELSSQSGGIGSGLEKSSM
jgi:hypothetical protein